MKLSLRKQLAASSILMGSAIFATGAYAQSTASADPAATAAQADQDTQEVIVTGSRIARPDLQSAVPLATVSSERILQTGATNIQDVLADLPQVGQNVSRSTTNFSNVGTGTATVNLRNLDQRTTNSFRTLVLINGRRSVGIAGTPAVDINNIPTDLVDRVDVITGGASAIYGSEAVAGVVNFILKDNFTGFRLRAQSKLSDKGDAADQFVSATGGFAFGDGKGHVVGNVTYDKDHGLRSRDRSFSAHDIPNRSSYASQGLFDVAGGLDSNTFAPGPNTFTFSPTNALKNYQGANIDGYDRAQDRYLSVPVERAQAMLLAHYDFSDAVKLYAEGSFVHTKSNAQLEPLAVANTGPGPALNFDASPYAGIPISSPFVPQEIRDQAILNGVDVIQFRRRSNDIFSRSNRVSRNYYRGVIGLKGDVGGWSYDVYYEHSQTRDHTTAGGIYAPNYGAALSNEVGPGGAIQCSDPAARAAGCVPINIFGHNTVSPEAAAFLTTYTGPTRTVTLIDGNTVQLTNGQSARYNYLAHVNQDVVSASVQRDLFSLWGSPSALVAGGEYRREKSSEVYDPFTQAGLSSGNQITNTKGKFNVKEAFAELDVPVIEDRPFVKYFGLEGAARYADYSTIGSVWSWKIGGTYAPTSDIRFRAIFNRATRAPNISELYSSLSQTFPALTDPCDQGGGEGDGAPIGALPAACAAVPGIANTVATRGQFAYSTSQIQTIDGLLGGNPNLREETASTLTLGTVITPHMVRNLSLTVDYYHIKVKNAIGIVGQQASVSQCLQTGDPFFCNNVVRDANGFVTRVNAININTGSLLVAGIDVEGRYSLPVDAFGGSRFDFHVQWNRRLKQQQTAFPGAPISNELGQADCYSCGRLGSGFRNRVNGDITFGTPLVKLNYRVQYLSPLRDNLDGSTSVVTRIPAYWYHDVQAKFLIGGERKMELYFGVNNLFDKKPPRFGDTNPVTWPGTSTVASTYDLFGRMVYAGVTFNF